MVFARSDTINVSKLIPRASKESFKGSLFFKDFEVGLTELTRRSYNTFLSVQTRKAFEIWHHLSKARYPGKWWFNWSRELLSR